MKITINRKETVQVMRVLSAKYERVGIEACYSEVALKAASKNESIEVELSDCKIEADGEAAFDSELFLSILEACPDDKALLLEHDKGTLTLSASHKCFAWKAQNPVVEPTYPGNGEATCTRIDWETLLRMVKWTRTAVCKEETQYAINGVLWELQDGQLALIATDGRRLARAWANVEANQEANLVLPAAFLDGVQNVTTDPTAELFFKESALFLHVGHVDARTKALERKFPKYTEVIPKDNTRIVRLKAKAFTAALAQARTLASDASPTVKCTFSQGWLELESVGNALYDALGTARSKCPYRCVGEEFDLRIGFNPRYLLDNLQCVDGDSEVEFALKDASSPAILRVGEHQLLVVMPVSLK